MAVISPHWLGHTGFVIVTLSIANGAGQGPGTAKALREAQVLPEGQQAAYKVVPDGQAEPAGSYTKGEPVPTCVPPVGAVHQVMVLLLPQVPFNTEV